MAVTKLNTLIIEPKEKESNKKPTQSYKPRKSRSFKAELLAYCTADAMWEGGGAAKSDNIRPVWAIFAGLEQETRSFVANLRCGYKAALASTISEYNNRKAPTRFDFLKSGGYRYSWQTFNLESTLESSNADGTNNTTTNRYAVVTAFLPDLFVLDPGMIDPDTVSFIQLMPDSWANRELAAIRQDRAKVQTVLAHAKALELLRTENGVSDSTTFATTANATNTSTQANVAKAKWGGLRFNEEQILDFLPQAAYFAAHLDKRTEKPLIDDLAFYLQLYFSALQEGIAIVAEPEDKANRNYYTGGNVWDWARKAKLGFQATGLEAVGITQQPVACFTTQERLNSFLAEQVKLYFSLTTSAANKSIINTVSTVKPKRSGKKAVASTLLPATSQEQTPVQLSLLDFDEKVAAAS